MRKLSKSEARLLALFSAAIFLAANLLGIRFWMTGRKALLQETSALEARIAEDREWIALARDFEDGTAWLVEHRPPAQSADDANTTLVEAVRQAAETHKLTISAETLLPPGGGDDLFHANLQIKLAGAYPGIVRLLYDLQTPEAWRSIDKITMRSDSTPPQTLVDLQVRQYFSTVAPSQP